MSVVDPALRISAQVALLGVISPEIRLVKVRRDGDEITLTTIVARPLNPEGVEALSIAATEVIADFPDCRIHERLIVSLDELPREDILEHGWLYQRREVR
jgi:hypothetical protein